MDESRPAFLPEVRSLLSSRCVAFKEIQASLLPQLPSSRLEQGAYLFPGSKFKLSHVILISRGHSGLLLICAYSKTLKFDQREVDRLVEKAGALNAEENLVLWKVERRGTAAIPVLEMTVAGRSIDKDLIWKCFGALDSRFKATSEEFTAQPVQLASQSDVPVRVKAFLTGLGFTRIKEAVMDGGHSLLVVLSDDDQPETSDLKRFPMKIEVGKLIVFKVYFSLKDAAVTAKRHFRSSAKWFVSQVNWLLPVGFYNYVSATKQIQYVIKLNSSVLSEQDFQVSLKSCYESSITWYKQTNEALAKLHNKTVEESLSITDMDPFLAECSNELQGEDQRTVLDFGASREEYGQFVEKLQRLAGCADLKPHFLNGQFFVVKPGEGKVIVKKKRTLLTFGQFMDKFPILKIEVFEKCFELLDKLKSVNIYPTMEMLYFSDGKTDIILIPDKGLHTSSEAFSRAILVSCLSEASLGLSTLTVEALTQERYSLIPIDTFEAIITTRFTECIIGKSKLAGDEYIFYKVRSAASSQLVSQLVQYRSLLDQRLVGYPNPLTGLTESMDCCNYEEEVSTSEAVLYYVCEQYNYKQWRGDAPIKELVQVANCVQTLHAQHLCHWFISPLTIRQHPSTKKISLVLPATVPFYAHLVSSFIPQVDLEYIAPEVERYLNKESMPEDNFSADVFSLCKVIQLHIGAVFDGGKLGRLKSVVGQGMEDDWTGRPSLREVISVLEEAAIAIETKRCRNTQRSDR